MRAALSLLTLLERQTQGNADKDLLSFALHTRDHYEANWHHRLLCEQLNAFAEGHIKRMMVFMPPRHGKSELVSRCLPAYLMGRNPDASIVATSYSASLASRMNRDVQRIMDSNEYKEVFPNTRLNDSNVRTLSGSWMRNSDLFEIVGHRGVYQNAGVGGGITGMGADYVIVDDPIKNQEEAHSLTYRQRVWDWYISTLYTRLQSEDSGVLVTLTRWHEDDLAGRLLKQAKEDPNSDQWVVVSLPAVKEGLPDDFDPREEGEALWPSRFPLELLEKNKANGSYFWNALFQQRPAPPEGAIVQRDWVKRYRELPKDVGDWLMSWDMTFKETRKGSFVCGQVWARDRADHYLVDQHRERMDFPATIAALKKMHKAYPQCRAILVEDAANGPAVIASLKKEIPGLIPVQVRGSKEARLHSVTPLIESGNVFIPDRRWAEELVEELVSFPNSAQNDQVDTLSQALNRYKSKRTGRLALNLDVGFKDSQAPWR